MGTVYGETSSLQQAPGQSGLVSNMCPMYEFEAEGIVPSIGFPKGTSQERLLGQARQVMQGKLGAWCRTGDVAARITTSGSQRVVQPLPRAQSG